MTTTLSADVDALLEAAAVAATSGLTIGEPTSFGAVADLAEVTAGLAGAVCVSFTGARSGEFALLVDAKVLQELTGGTADADPAAALGPAVSAVAGALGEVSVGAAAALEPAQVGARLARFADASAIAVRGASGVRAVIALGLETQQWGQAGRSVPADRLDLLRGVEMEASVELGRARMTVNELISLRPGAVIELDRAAGEPADLYVNGRLLAHGEVVVVEENYALRITQIVSEDNAR